MKRYISYFAVLLAVLLGAACSKDDSAAGSDNRTGVMAMTVSTRQTADTGEYDPLQHQTVYIYNDEGGLLRKYTSKEACPERLELLAGTYRVAVEAGEEAPADFTKRLYKGEETFTVKPGETTNVAVVCQIVNTVVEVKFDDSILQNLAPGYSVWIAGGEKVDEQAAGTGIIATHSYDFRAIINGTETTGTFTAGEVQPIPNGDMSGWSMTGGFAFPNAAGESFWSSGNNTMTKTLCTSTDVKFGKSAPAAKLTSTNMLVLAAGNLFTGEFAYKSFTGTVQFGQTYAFTARPSAMKVKYHAHVGTVDKVRTSGDICPYIKKGDPDMARIFVAIVDWNAPHEVVSGMTTTKGAWDPEKGIDNVSEGKILGYGSLWITQSTDGEDMQDAELDIVWYDHETRPAEGKYSLVISCACNAYGDYFTGCSKNVMYVDDFEWVY